MNGNLAQIIALTCHGNKFLQDSKAISFFRENSTCRYDEFVKFVEWKEEDSEKEPINEIADSPNEWFSYLKSNNAAGIRILMTPRNKDVAEDRTSAGFVGGGVIQEMIVTYSNGKNEKWRGKYTVGNRDAHDDRIWQILYGFSKKATIPTIEKKNIDVIYQRLINALEDIKNYSEPHESLKMYTERFASALNVMINVDHNLESKEFIYHDDLYPEDYLDEKAMAILSACQMVEIFGGMGTWNDPPPHAGNHDEYKKISNELYLAINEGFVVATNSSFRF